MYNNSCPDTFQTRNLNTDYRKLTPVDLTSPISLMSRTFIITTDILTLKGPPVSIKIYTVMFFFQVERVALPLGVGGSAYTL